MTLISPNPRHTETSGIPFALTLNEEVMQIDLSKENDAAVQRGLATLGCRLSYITTLRGGLHLDSWSMLNAILNAAREDERAAIAKAEALSTPEGEE